jgi:hypothetical protein
MKTRKAKKPSEPKKAAIDAENEEIDVGDAIEGDMGAAAGGRSKYFVDFSDTE